MYSIYSYESRVNGKFTGASRFLRKTQLDEDTVCESPSICGKTIQN